MSHTESSPLRTFALTVAYDGTHYAGWQVQPNGETIQQKLIDAVSNVLHEPAQVQGSGRTDAGVHATGQVCGFSTTRWPTTPDRLVRAINGFLPRDISVLSAREVVNGFDPIRNARGKRYRYTIRNSEVPDPIYNRLHWWIPRPLSIDSMREAAQHLLGTHDFTSFVTLGSQRKTSVRTIRTLSIESHPALAGNEIWIEIEADGFLYNMVRNITGALVEVGLDRFSTTWIKIVLEAQRRDSSSQTAPARGLCLREVHYPPSLFLTETNSLAMEHTTSSANESNPLP